MHRLLLLRHAKAEPEGSGPDFDRALASRGRSDARAMGALIAERGLAPDFAAVSSARRTKETWELVAAAFPEPCPPKYDSQLYGASEKTLLAAIRAIPGKHRCAILIGHNPGIESLAKLLADKGARRDLQNLHEKFPTCALAVIDLDIEGWKEAAPQEGTLQSFITPADIAGRK